MSRPSSSGACVEPGCDAPLLARGWCNTHYHRWYRTQPHAKAKSQAYDRQRRQAIRDAVDAIKLERECADCGYSVHAAALQFDHRPGEAKLFNIGQVDRCMDVILAEIVKCDVRCANCHMIRHYRHGNLG